MPYGKAILRIAQAGFVLSLPNLNLVVSTTTDYIAREMRVVRKDAAALIPGPAPVKRGLPCIWGGAP